MRGVKKKDPEKTSARKIRIVHVPDPRPGVAKLACGISRELSDSRGHEVAKSGERVNRLDLCQTCALFARWEGFADEVIAL